MKKILIALCITVIAGLNTPANYAQTVAPVHNGKCGKNQSHNMGEALLPCNVGDVVLLEKKILAKYCDFRYQIIKHSGSGALAHYYCVLRVKKTG